MAKLLQGTDGVTAHLRGIDNDTTLCGEGATPVPDGTLMCSTCAAIALRAIELTTKSERREWRKL